MMKKKPQYATKHDVKQITTKIVGEAVDAILGRMDQITKNMATKEELKEVKEELKAEISFVRNDIKGLTEEFALTPSREEFNNLKMRVSQISAT